MTDAWDPACSEVERLIDGMGKNVKEVRQRIAAIPHAAECIEQGMREAVDTEDWYRFQGYVLAAWHAPSRELTPILCEVLDRRVDESNAEDVVELLHKIGDERAVHCLEGALWWHPDWDEFHWLALKAVAALDDLGTPEALNALKGAAETGPERVREAAAQSLAWHDAHKNEA